MNVYQKLEELGILPVIHISKAEWAEPLAQALTAGGIDALEVVFRSENAAEILSTLKKNHPEMMIGAGTILTIPQAEQALEEKMERWVYLNDLAEKIERQKEEK